MKITEAIQKLVEIVDSIPCTCHEAYKSRGLVAPDCPRCHYVDEDELKSIKETINNKMPYFNKCDMYVNNLGELLDSNLEIIKE